MPKKVLYATSELDSFIRSMKSGDHMIFFYDTAEHKQELLFNFLADGLAKGEGAVYICSDESPEQIRQSMKTFGFDFSKFEKEETLMIKNYEGWYSENGQFQTAKILAHIKETCEIFRNKGIEELRGCGEMGCFFKYNAVRELLKYEYALHRVLRVPLKAICAYSTYDMVSRGYADIIMPLVRAHRKVIFAEPYGFIAHKPEKVEDSDVEKLMQIKI